MDQLRRTADTIAIEQSIASIHTLRNRFIASRSPDSSRIVKAIDNTLSVLSRETEGTEWNRKAVEICCGLSSIPFMWRHNPALWAATRQAAILADTGEPLAIVPQT